MMIYQIISYGCGPKLTMLLTLCLSMQLNDDPGWPGGDPDLPDAPLDGGVYWLVALALIFGLYKMRTQPKP